MTLLLWAKERLDALFFIACMYYDLLYFLTKIRIKLGHVPVRSYQ